MHLRALKKVASGHPDAKDIVDACTNTSQLVARQKHKKGRAPRHVASYVARRFHEISAAQIARDSLRHRPWFLEPCAECLAAAGDECRHCKPRMRACPACQSKNCELTCINHAATLYGRSRSVTVEVYELHCLDCQHTEPYDGKEDGVFNRNNDTLMHEELPRSYWDNFADQRGGTFTAHHAHTARRYEYNGESRLLSRQTYLDCMRDFLSIVDTDETVAMCCPVCRWLPHEDLTLLFDGIEQGMPIGNVQQPPQYTRQGDAPDIKMNKYLVIDNRPARQLLKRYVQTHDVNFKDMREAVAKTNNGGCVVGLLDYARQHDRDNRCPKSLRRFMLWLSSNSPARSIIDSEASRSNGLLTKEWLPCQGPLTLAMNKDIARCFPALSELMADNPSWTTFPDFLRPVLEKIGELARLPCQAPWYDAGEETLDEALWVCAPQFKAASNVLPNYGADRRGAPKDVDNDACTKLVHSCATMSHGAVTVQCPHNVLLGFVVLHRHESPKAVFEFLRRKLTTGPRLVVYDNSCALEYVCMKRDPAFFSATRFRVDRFHFAGHKACGEGMSLDSWPASTPIVSQEDLDTARRRAALAGQDDLVPRDAAPIFYKHRSSEMSYNSSAAEQNNAMLRYIGVQVAYMTHEHYVQHFRQFIYRRNIMRLANMYNCSEIECMRKLWVRRPGFL